MSETMELKEFIATSLREIIQAVHEVQIDPDIKTTGARINPNPLTSKPEKKASYMHNGHEARPIIQEVNFDIAVTVASGQETKGGIAVFGGALALGSQGKSDISNDIASRLRFSIPFTLPIERD